MKFASIVRAISPFTKSLSADKGNAVSSTNHKKSEHTWDLTDVDLKYALKLFYKKFNPEKSFIVADIIQKYVGEEQLLLQQLQERYNLSHDEMQSYLDKATSQTHGLANSDKRKSLHQSRDVELGVDWDINDVNVASLLQFIYSIYNPTRTPNVEVLKQKSQKDILTILRQLCKRHNLSHSDMNGLIERFRGHIEEFPSETIDKGENIEYVEQSSHIQTSEYNNNGSPPNEVKNEPEDIENPKPASSRKTSITSLSVTPVISGRRSSVDASNYHAHPIDSTSSTDTKERISNQSIRYRPLSTTSSVEQVAKMDEVLRQMNVRQYNNPPPPPPPKQRHQSIQNSDNSVENHSLLYRELQQLQQTCSTQQTQLIELQEMVEQLRIEKVRLLEEKDELHQNSIQKSIFSVGTQAMDPSQSVDIEQLQLNLHETIQANDRFRQDADRMRRKQSEDIERLQRHCKGLQGDRENILQFINALCLHCAPARHLIGAYFKILQTNESIPTSNDEELVSDRLDRLFQWIRQQPSQQLIDHRKLILEASTHLKENELNLHETENSNSLALQNIGDVTDENIVMQQQFDLAKKLIDTKKKQSRMESRLAEANQILKQSVLAKAVDKAERDIVEVATDSIENSQTSPHESNSTRASSPRVNNHKATNGVHQQKQLVSQSNACDWIECIDPKSKRKYYYSPSLKKSTWTRPVSLAENIPNQHMIQSSAEAKNISNEIKSASRRSLRGASPTPSLQSACGTSSVDSDRSSSTSLFSQRSNSVRYSSPNVYLSTESDWIAAVDPKSGQKYYFNRKTKASTWRKPIELI